MPRNLTLRLTAMGQDLVTRNRKVSHQPWKWGRAAVIALVLATAGVMLASLILAYVDLQYLTVNQEISQAFETHKQLQDLNRKLRTEYSNLKTVSHLEHLAVNTYGMRPPQPSQVIYLP